jgi:integrase
MAAEGRTLTTVGPKGRRIAIETRTDGSVRARWYLDGKKERVTLPNLYVSAGQDTLSAADQRRAETIGLQLSHALGRGEDPRRIVEKMHERRKPALKESSLAVVGGKYFAAETGTVVGADSLVNYRKYFADVSDILGDGFDLDTLSVGTVELLARELAAECVAESKAQAKLAKKSEKIYAEWLVRKSNGLVRKNGKAPPRVQMPPENIRGHVQTLKSISWCFTLARWGFDRLQLKRQPALPQHWKDVVTAIWTKATNQKPKVVREFHSLNEMRQIFSVRDKMDPRLDNMITVALGSRLGQTRRTLRSELELIPYAHARGRLFIPWGGRKKPGLDIDLSRRAERAFRKAFATYLKPWEDKYRAGLIQNYHLYPGGPLADLAQSTGDPNWRCLTEGYLGELFDAAEEIAGVTKVPLRRFHGLRRFMRNTAARMEKDTRVLDCLIGHSVRGVGAAYEDTEDEWMLRRTYDVREAIIKKVTQKPERTNGHKAQARGKAGRRTGP